MTPTATILVCRGCCCDTDDPIVAARELATLRRAVTGLLAGRLRVTNCLGPCEERNLVAARHRDTDHPGRRLATTWLARLGRGSIDDLAEWLADGAVTPFLSGSRHTSSTRQRRRHAGQRYHPIRSRAVTTGLALRSRGSLGDWALLPRRGVARLLPWGGAPSVLAVSAQPLAATGQIQLAIHSSPSARARPVPTEPAMTSGASGAAASCRGDDQVGELLAVAGLDVSFPTRAVGSARQVSVFWA